MRFILRLGNSCCPIPEKNIIVPDNPIIPDDPDNPIIPDDPDNPIIPDDPDDNNYAWVEIGGLRWATMNIGAVNEFDTGLYFQWGDTQGYTASQVGSGSGQKYFGWADYKYNNGGAEPTAENMTKYNSTDGKTVLDLSDDAARAAWGGAWRMPTTEEYAALGAAVNTAWTTDYQGSGVAGMICTDKTDSSKELFFPAVGICINGGVYSVGSYGDYWSGSLYSGGALGGRSLNFGSDGVYWQNNGSRYLGFTVRGVMDII